MKNLLLILCLFLAAFNANSQVNLVPNPSFEEYTNCPNNGYKTVYLSDWDLDFNTSDFFHECSTINYSIPNNVYGNQCASTGNSYTGLIPYIIFLQADRREYIGGKLTDSLIIGTKYYVTFKVSLATNSICAVNNLGIKFIATDRVDSNSFTPHMIIPPPYINNFSQVYYPTIITDSIYWTTVRGSFVADSSYINFLIGNFYTTTNTDSIVQPGWPTCQSYYYLDDVCISTDSIYCENIKNQIINISADSTIIVQNSCINFNLQTVINYSTYEWHFNGGFPATSNQMNPNNICYLNTGIYDVTFIGHKQGGCTDTLNLKDYIHVDTLTATMNHFETKNSPYIAFKDNVVSVFNLNDPVQFSITDVTGKTVAQGQLSSLNTIDCNYYIAGTYIFKTNNSLLKPFKFIINPKSN
jgi:hypothetical protein